MVQKLQLRYKLSEYNSIQSIVDTVSEQLPSSFLPKDNVKITNFLSELQNIAGTSYSNEWNSNITVGMVSKALNGLKVNKSTGSDGLAAK